MAPVHEHEMDRSALGVLSGQRQRVVQERMKLSRDSSPEPKTNSRCLVLPRPRIVLIFRLYGDVRYDHRGALACHQSCDVGRTAGIAAQKPMRTEGPEVTPLSDRPFLKRRKLVSGVLFTIDMVFEQGIDFRRFKAGETKINTGVGKEGTKFRELDGQRGAIPSAFLCKFIVAVYGLRTRARCAHSPDPAMAPVLGHRDCRDQPEGHLQEGSHPAADQRDEHGQGRERQD